MFIMAVDFQISYTLDVLSYISCMLDEKKKNLYDEDIRRFMPMLGTVSDKYLEKLIKINQNTPDFMDHIISMLIVNDHLHDWKTSDLLDRHKRLVVVFKKTKCFEKASKKLKRFIQGDYSKAMPLIKTIAADLERLSFKKFWLEEKLPRLKERNLEYQQKLDEFDIATHVNKWLVTDKIPTSGQWYMLAYGGVHFKLLLETYPVTSPLLLADDLFKKVVSYGLEQVTYRPYLKGLKPTPDLKAEFKNHEDYKGFKGFLGYGEKSLKLALEVYLLENCGEKGFEISENYPFAMKLVDELRENKKPADEPVANYIPQVIKTFSRK